MRLLPVLTFASVALLVLASDAAPASDSTEQRPPTPVLEQNVDQDGNIRVRQQGVVDAAVTNLPTTLEGALRTHLESVDGVLSVEGTVGLDPAANAVAIDPAIQTALDAIEDSLAAIKAQVDRLEFDAASNLQVVTPPGGDTVDIAPATMNPMALGESLPWNFVVFGCRDGLTLPVRGGEGALALITGVTFSVDEHDALLFFRLGDERVHVVSAKANEPATFDFSHPLLVDSARVLVMDRSIDPDEPCRGYVWNFTGHVIPAE